MITIKLKYIVDQDFQDFIVNLRKQFSNLYRYSYNRLYEGKIKNEIYHLILSLNNINLIKSKMILDAIDFANNLYKKDKKNEHKSIFGGKKNFISRCNEKLTKEQFLLKRLVPLYVQGEHSRNGNRYFNLDFLNNNITFKYSRNQHFNLQVKPSKNQLKQLIQLQNLKQKYTITLNDKTINISFEPIKNQNIKFSNDRFLGIDMNPSCIGISILNSKMDVIDSQMFDFSEIIDKIKNLNKASNSKEIKYLNNKLNHEILDISKKISDISIHYKCKFIFIEELNFKNSNKGKAFNRLTKNLWKRNIFIENLNKRCEINGQKLFKINPAYSSFIGNCMYNYSDPINASIEIARRGYEIIIKKSKQFYPTFWLKDSLIHRWKEMVSEMPDNWKELYDLTKNLKLRYRVSLEEVISYSVFSKKVRMYKNYQFS